jgi:4-amino-4-deoxy-L-arabinose transferase-like glycosyltransferase
VFFGGIAPTLPWLEFAGGMENVTVATAQEIVLKGDADTWALPTLNDEPRTRKPPLVHWITALGIQSSDCLAWGARWPGLLAACLTLAAVYALGRVVGGWRMGLIAAMICGSTLLFLRYARQAQYDVHLSLWVVLTNLALARIVLDGKWLGPCAMGGVCLGLALMSKGPPALVQTLVPVACFSAWRRWCGGQDVRPADPTPARRRLAAILLGVGLMLLVTLPWVVYAASRPRTGGFAGLIKLWMSESTLQPEAAYEKRSKPLDYLAMVPLLFPWFVWFFIGLWFLWRERRTQEGRRRMLLVFLLLAPLLIMSFFAVRRDRYTLPMLGPAAIIAARGVMEHLARWHAKWDLGGRAAIVGHWLIVGVLAIGFPLWGAWKLTTVEGTAWFTPPQAMGMAGAMGAVVLLGAILHARWRGGLVAATVAVMLMWQAAFVWGYKDSLSGRSSRRLAEAILASPYRDAPVINGHPTGKSAPIEMTIYLARPIRWKRPSAIRAGDRPQVVLLNDLKSVAKLPPGTTLIASDLQESGRWYAYVVPPRPRGRATRPTTLPATRL